MAVLTLSLLPIQVRAITDSDIGDPGVAGSTGADGNPPGNGGAGGDGESAVANAAASVVNETASADAQGGEGGKGGDGGNANAGSNANGGNGGNGGVGGNAEATSSSLGISASDADAQGGSGGSGGASGAGDGVGTSGVGGDGGAGGEASANALAVSDDSPQFGGGAQLFVHATGGFGGDGYSGSGSGGNGGNAVSSAVLNMVPFQRGSIVESFARGGDAGKGYGLGGTGGDGGTATAISTGVQSIVTIDAAPSGSPAEDSIIIFSAGPDENSFIANATGGHGGEVNGANKTGGLGGRAVAIATTDSVQIANVSATANGGRGGSGALGGSARAFATGSAAIGEVVASAKTAGSFVSNVSAEARSPLGEVFFPPGPFETKSTASAGAGVSTQSVMSELTQANSMAFATGLPTAEEQASLLAGSALAATDPNAVYGIAVLGVSYAENGNYFYTASTSFSFDTGNMDPGLSLQIGLLNPIAGIGSDALPFDVLTFTIYIEGVASSQTFPDFASAQAYFSDRVLDFGSIDSLTSDGSLDVKLELALAGTDANSVGDSFRATILLADSIHSVPEPSVCVLFGLAGLGFVVRRRRASV